ncbi:hypothetical protein ACWC24_19585 [Streptomyces sp. NPDC001443]
MKRRDRLRGAMAAGLTAPALAALTAARTGIDRTLSPACPGASRRVRPAERGRRAVLADSAAPHG